MAGSSSSHAGGARRRGAQGKTASRTAVINGIVAVPALLVVMLVSSDQKLMKDRPVRGVEAWLGWLTTGVMGVAAVALIVLTLTGS